MRRLLWLNRLNLSFWGAFFKKYLVVTFLKKIPHGAMSLEKPMLDLDNKICEKVSLFFIRKFPTPQRADR